MSDRRRKERAERTGTHPERHAGSRPARVIAPAESVGPGRKLQASRRVFLISLVLIAATAAVYAPVRNYEFVEVDDPAYVSENPAVSGGLTRQGIVWAFTTGHAANWHPLTWLSHMADVQLFGMSPGRHHLTSLMLHIANAVLLFLLLVWMTGAAGRSAFVAGLFALHPLHVESVAWVAERKDVLSTLFWLLATGAYVAYARAPRRGRYLVLILLFALGLMAKPMLVTLPFVFLLLDVWPLGRAARGSGDRNLRGWRRFSSGWIVWRPLVLEKVPLIALAAVSGAVTIWMQRAGGAVAELQKIPLSLRVENALVCYVAYIGKMLWPARLAVLYPIPTALSAWQVVGAAFLLAGLTVAAVRLARRRPYVAVGWFWYLGTLVPVIGLIQVGLQAMADRYSYAPLIGIFIILAWGIPDALSRWPLWRRVLPAFAVLAVLACAIITRRQTGYWENGSTLWAHELEAVLGMDESHAQEVLASVFHNRGAKDEAPGRGSPSVSPGSDAGEVEYNQGLAMARAGRIDEAVTHFAEAVRLQPGFADARMNLGRALASLGNAGEARAQFSEAVRLAPDSAEAHHDLGLSLLRLGRIDEAVESLAAAVRLNPGYAEAQGDLGFALSIRGESGPAIEHLTEAVRLKPDFAEAHNNLGTALVRERRSGEALPHFAEAVRLKPDFELARRNLGISLAGAGRIDEAISQFREVLRINPQNEEIRKALEALAQQSRRPGRR